MARKKSEKLTRDQAKLVAFARLVISGVSWTRMSRHWSKVRILPDASEWANGVYPFNQIADGILKRWGHLAAPQP